MMFVLMFINNDFRFVLMSLCVSDVVRLARPNPRLFLVDVIRPPVPPADPVQTNEVGVDDELPRLVRVLVPAPELPLPDEDYQPRPAPPHEGE